MPSFTLPDHVDIDAETLQAVAKRHGLDADAIERLPETGIINAVYQVGESAILRVPRNHPDFIAHSYREAFAMPAARAAGVRTPALLAFDTSLELVPVPYTVYERVPGVTLESLGLAPDEAVEVWRAYGRNLALAHTGVTVNHELDSHGPRYNSPKLPALIQTRAEEGWLSPLDARWLGGWADRLAPSALTPVPARFVHGDTQASNLMVWPDPLQFAAIIDWGSAAVGDVALDFAGVPLRAVPHMLAGYREIASLDADETAEARIVWRMLDLALRFLPRGAVPSRSWAERPLPMLLEVLRFFLDQQDDRWRAVGPVVRPADTSSRVEIGGAAHV